MSIWGMVLTGVMTLIGFILTIIILLQSGRQAGLGAVSANNSETYWHKNRGNSMEGALEKYTKIGGALFLIIGFVVMLVR